MTDEAVQEGGAKRRRFERIRSRLSFSAPRSGATRVLAVFAAAGLLAFVFATIGGSTPRGPEPDIYWPGDGPRFGPHTAQPAGPGPMSSERAEADAADPGDAAEGASQQVVRRGDVEIRVDRGSFADAWEAANATADRFGGFVSSSQAETVDDRLARGVVTLRIPADRLDAALSELRALGVVVSENMSATDVSDRLLDMDARLRSFRAQEAQYLELIRRAGNVSEVLEVQARLDEVRTRIESLDAQREGLQADVDYSNLRVTIYEPNGGPEEDESGRLSEILRRGGDSAISVLTGMLVTGAALAPIFALGLIGWAGTRAFRRRKR